MERPIFKPIGTPVEELDTPALVLDLATMEHNIETVHGFFRGRTAKIRPHVKTHKCPALAHRQLAVEGTVGGICTAKVGEAEVFAQSGFNDILIANEVVTRPKITRICALARHCKMTVAVDSAQNIRDLSQAAQTYDVTLNVLVDINNRLNRCGVAPGKPAVDLAKTVAKAPGLHFAGLMAYEGCLYEKERTNLEAETRRCLQPVLDTRQMVERAGLPVETVSVGGTHNYDIAGSTDGVTEGQAGSYVVMDHNYCQYRRELRPALRVLGTVVSHPEPSVAITDMGQKAIGADLGLPVIDGLPGAKVRGLSAEHGTVVLEGPAQQRLDLWSKVWQIPFDAEICLNLYNYIHAVRDGKLEAVWEIAARGRYD